MTYDLMTYLKFLMTYLMTYRVSSGYVIGYVIKTISISCMWHDMSWWHDVYVIACMSWYMSLEVYLIRICHHVTNWQIYVMSYVIDAYVISICNAICHCMLIHHWNMSLHMSWSQHYMSCVPDDMCHLCSSLMS